eukprot:TRINITY_DN1849_c0_g2_i1.p1 TRINITY_DN1849_c0_g2~~TRINITY_DN1849_c0_g2_i1.p1  ORF type:complete len:504 (+),score=104.50 TRINITY_DN1849_c0_g2_i1:184-1695(+)
MTIGCGIRTVHPLLENCESFASSPRDDKPLLFSGHSCAAPGHIEGSCISSASGSRSGRSSRHKLSPQMEKKKAELDGTVRLLFFSSQGDVDGMRDSLNEGVDINSSDYDGRTALHLASSEGRVASVDFLLRAGANVNPKDRFGNTPLADANAYKHCEIIKMLERRGGRTGEGSGSTPRSSLRAFSRSRSSNSGVPDYEIDPAEVDLKNSTLIGRGQFGEVRLVNWRGTRVAVKTILSQLSNRPNIEKEFKEELAILQKLRHPNVVQFLGAVTLSSPLMLVTEYLPRGDLHSVVKRKGPLSPEEAVQYTLDIARGMNYLHQHKPKAVVHRDLKPQNLLRDDSGHLKVADFGLSCMLQSENSPDSGGGGEEEEVPADSVKLNVRQMTEQAGSYRYMAPEVFRKESYDKMCDVFSFAVIVHEMFEGGQQFKLEEPIEVAKKYASGVRPAFRALSYPQGMKQLICECWDSSPKKRPSFAKILEQLEHIQELVLNPPTPSTGCSCTIL